MNANAAPWRYSSLTVAGAALALALVDALPGVPAVDDLTIALAGLVAVGALGAVAWTLKAEGRLGAAVARAAAGLVTITISLGLALVAAEYAARYVFRDVTTTADLRSYFASRWQRRQPPPNNFGFRDREFTLDKAPGTYRIAVVGDSFAYGNGLSAAQRFSDLLQSSLPQGFEVYNFGLPGANTPDHVTALRRTVARFKPDFVLVQWFVNDVEGDDSKGRPAYTPLIPYAPLHERLYRASALYSAANFWWSGVQAARPGHGYEDYMRARFLDPAGEGARLDRQAMRDLVAEGRRAGGAMGIVFFPDAGYDLGASYPFGFLHDREMALCAEAGLTCLDLRADFAGVADRRSLWVNRFDHHPSALANRIAAGRIREAFEAAWLARRTAQ